MSEKFLVKEARRRAEIFSNLAKYLKIIVDSVREIDSSAKIYLFGSVAEGRHLLSSDIDILVVTNLSPSTILSALWDKGIKEPFEIHVVTEDVFNIYRKRAKIIDIEEVIKRNSQYLS